MGPHDGQQSRLDVRRLDLLGHPVFLLSLFLLILNDWFMKPAFHNDVTGKVSDFAGLFALPWVLACLLPRFVGWVHVIIALAFMLWKSEMVDPLITALNAWHIPVERTPDPTDNVALVSIAISWLLMQRGKAPKFHRSWATAILVVATFAFIATTLPPRGLRAYTVVNASYEFDFSRKKLIEGLNTLTAENVGKLSDLIDDIEFVPERRAYVRRGTTDTLALLMDADAMPNGDTVFHATSLAEMVIWGNDSTSGLRLVSIYRHSYGSQLVHRDRVVRVFERRVIRKLKKLGRKIH